MKLAKLICPAAFFMIASLTACGQAEKATLVLKNGAVYTVDQEMSQAEAVAISDGKILAVGSNAEIESRVNDDTRVIDLQGKTVVPGFIDSHYHFMGVGRIAFKLNLDGTRSLQEFLNKVRERAENLPEGEWISGRGWIEEDWPEKRFPTRHDLDSVAPRHPVLLKRADGHGTIVNSLALKLAKLTSATPDPEGGQILRDDKGEPNGMLLEDNAKNLVEDLIPPDTSKSIMRKYALKANEVALGYGLTTIHNMGQPWKNNFDRVWGLWQQMYKDKQLKVRINTYVEWPFEDVEKILDEGPQAGLFDDRLALRGIKITADGALGSRGAVLLEKYNDADTKGLLIHQDERIYSVIKRALGKDLQMAIHAIGDAANRKILDLYQKAFEDLPEKKDPRFRIEHSQIVHLDDISRFKELGVIPSMQPSHAIGDLHFAVRRLGLDRMPEGYAWRKFIDQGSIIPAGSDAPVEEGNPLIEFYAATVRKDTTGFSAAGWLPEYRMTREEALRSLTIWGAKAVFMEDKIGSIEPGKYADMVVLDRNLMTEPEERLFDIRVLKTFVAGELVYQQQ